jgi:hypothetical protein
MRRVLFWVVALPIPIRLLAIMSDFGLPLSILNTALNCLICLVVYLK